MIYSNLIKQKQQKLLIVHHPWTDQGGDHAQQHQEPAEVNCTGPKPRPVCVLGSGVIFTTSVHDKVVGKPSQGTKAKAKAGQGDFQSLIFWTNEKAEIMFLDRLFIVFHMSFEA